MKPDQPVWSRRTVIDITLSEAREWPVVRGRDAGGDFGAGWVQYFDGRPVMKGHCGSIG